MLDCQPNNSPYNVVSSFCGDITSDVGLSKYWDILLLYIAFSSICGISELIVGLAKYTVFSISSFSGDSY